MVDAREQVAFSSQRCDGGGRIHTAISADLILLCCNEANIRPNADDTKGLIAVEQAGFDHRSNRPSGVRRAMEDATVAAALIQTGLAAQTALLLGRPHADLGYARRHLPHPNCLERISEKIRSGRWETNWPIKDHLGHRCRTSGRTHGGPSKAERLRRSRWPAGRD